LSFPKTQISGGGVFRGRPTARPLVSGEEARGPKASEGWLGRADEVAPEGAGQKKCPTAQILLSS